MKRGRERKERGMEGGRGEYKCREVGMQRTAHGGGREEGRKGGRRGGGGARVKL